MAAGTWKSARLTEWDQLTDFNTFNIQDRLHKHSIGTRLVSDLKRNADGNIENLKARFIVRGFKQRLGIDVQSIFAPTASLATLKALLVLSIKNNWLVNSFDITGLHFPQPTSASPPDNEKVQKEVNPHLIPTYTPLPGENLVTSWGDPVLPTLYRSLIGSINYLALGTRPDSSFAVNYLARFSSNPNPIVPSVIQTSAHLDYNFPHQIPAKGQAPVADNRDRLITDLQVETVFTQLPPFDGKDDLEIWVTKIKTILRGRNYPMDRWSMLVPACMKGEAESWWLQQVKEEGSANFAWADFKSRLLADSPAHSSADSYAYSALSEDFIGNLAGQAYDSGHLASESDDELDRIGDEIDSCNGKFSQRILTNDFWSNASELVQIGNKIEGRNNLFSDKTLGTEFWKVAQEAEGRRIWDQIEENLVPLDPSASLFVPGAKEHYMKNSYELNLNFMESSSVDGNNIRTCLKRKSNSEEIVLERPAKKVTFKTPEIDELDSSTGGSYIEWMRLVSDEDSVNYEIASLFSDDESIIWMGDSLGIMKSPPMPTLQALPRPPVELNVLENLDLNVSEGTTRLPHYDVNIGGIMCDTIVDSGAGAIYLDTRLAKELLRRREITTKRIEDINVRLANGQIEKVGWIGLVRINFDNYEMDLEAYLIDLPDIDLVLGLPWLRKGFKFLNNVLYGPQPGGQLVPVITDLNKARTIARETHVRLGHQNARDTLYQNNSNRNKMPLQESGNQYLVTATDYGTGWAYATPLKARSSLAAVKLVKAIIENHGLPHLITTDNGQEFEGNLFKNYLEGHQIKHNRISPYHPQTNGLVKRFHGTLMNRLRKYCVPDCQDEWDLYIVVVTTQEYCDDEGKAPIEDIGVFRQEQIDEVNRKARLGSLNTERDLKIGSTVLRHYKQHPSKLHPKWDGPFIIYHSNPNGSYKLRAPNGHPLKGPVNGD
ncbi:hypothetical protein MJO29_015073 [Puccinia striiformis f. sp. tritici]|nr:hypothetical protein MJO29_015073 [Puccinia striiformis f. sp. tritici]